MINLNTEDVVRVLSAEILRGLPGRASHERNAPQFRFAENYSANPPNARQSAVLVLLYPEQSDLKLVLFRRTRGGGAHSGQISFPGGKVESTDVDLRHTALRETEEEVGIPEANVRVIGELTPIYIPVSNFSVQPILAYTPGLPVFDTNDGEVHELVLPRVSSLFAFENRYTRKFERSGKTFEAVCLNADGHEVWGATAIILAEVEDLCRRSGLL